MEMSDFQSQRKRLNDDNTETATKKSITQLIVCVNTSDRKSISVRMLVMLVQNNSCIVSISIRFLFPLVSFIRFKCKFNTICIFFYLFVSISLFLAPNLT